MLMRKTQWSDYIERVLLDIVTNNRTENNNVDDGVNHQVLLSSIKIHIHLGYVTFSYQWFHLDMYTYWYHFVIQTIHTSEQQSAFVQDYKKCTIQPGNGAIGTAPAYLRPAICIIGIYLRIHK